MLNDSAVYGNVSHREEAGVRVTTSSSDLLEELQSIVRKELDQPDLQVTALTAVGDIPDWDSLAHVRIIVAIESRFRIFFDPDEYTQFANVGEMVDSIVKKIDLKSHAAVSTAA